MRRLVRMRRHLSAIGLAGLVLAAGVVLAACGGGQNGAPATVTVTAAEGSQPPPASVDQTTEAVETDSVDEAGLTTTQLDPASARERYLIGHQLSQRRGLLSRRAFY